MKIREDSWPKRRDIMGFDRIKNIGMTALSFIPGVGPIISGLHKVAGIIGGAAGEKIKNGISAVSEGLTEAGKNPMSPEQQMEIEKARMDTEVEMAEIGFKKEKLNYDDAAGGREIVKTALLSDDPVVRQARPRMMVKLGNYCILFAFYAPVSVIAAGHAHLSAATMTDFMSMLKWIGGFLFSAFMTSFTGYTVARSADKKIAAGGAPGKVLNMIAGLGRKIA